MAGNLLLYVHYDVPEMGYAHFNGKVLCSSDKKSYRTCILLSLFSFSWYFFLLANISIE